MHTYDLLTFLYLFNGGIAMVSYIPQCRKLYLHLQTKQISNEISLTTWLMWLWAGGTTFLYSLFAKEQDLAFITISAVNLLFCVITVVLIVFVRKHDRKIAHMRKVGFPYYRGSKHYD